MRRASVSIHELVRARRSRRYLSCIQHSSLSYNQNSQYDKDILDRRRVVAMYSILITLSSIEQLSILIAGCTDRFEELTAIQRTRGLNTTRSFSSSLT